MVSRSSPAKRRHDTLSGHPPSPLSSKRQRISVSLAADSTPGPIPGNDSDVLYSFNDMNDKSNNKSTEPDVSARLVTEFTSINDSLQAMHAETHQNRLVVRTNMIKDKATVDLYQRHLKNYEKFIARDQAMRAQQNPHWKVVEAHPITATKVATFLQYETTRPQQTPQGKDKPGTRVGPNHIAQCISALESYRYHHKGSDPLYKADPEAQRALRDDERVSTYEKASYATEAERVEQSQELKASGVTSDTFTEDELVKGSMWLLESSWKTRNQVHLGLRDRAMLLISTSTAYRGNNLRRLLVSDISSRCLPLIDMGLDVKVTATIFRSNTGKTNLNGRIDDQGVLRHRLPELCAVGALGLYLFSQFHIMNVPVPSFVPNFTHPKATSEKGYREWYSIVLFPGAEGQEMTYENHNKRMNAIKAQNEIETKKVTHGGRSFFALYAREHGASEADTRHGGGWGRTTAFDKSYNRMLPVEAILAAAGFNGRRQDSYFIARDKLQPPEDLTRTLFPWAESELSALDNRIHTTGKAAVDPTLRSFLNVLQLLRSIIVQDAAVLHTKYPHCPLWKYPPFNTLAFRTFAGTAHTTIQSAEEEARLRLENLPHAVATSFHGMVLTNHMQQDQARDELREATAQLRTIQERLDAYYAPPGASKRQQGKKRAKTVHHITAVLEPAAVQATTAVPTSAESPTTESPRAHTGSSFPDTDPAAVAYPAGTFPISDNVSTRAKQLAYISVLESKFSRDRLSKHRFEWIISSKRNQEDEYLPNYSYWTPNGQGTYPSIREIWEEYTFGIDGHLSVSALNAGWNARWRSSGAARTETSRRKKITDLIDTLSAKPNWTADLALRYLETKYTIPTTSVPHLRTTRAFIERLQKQDGLLRLEILTNANNYCS